MVTVTQKLPSQKLGIWGKKTISETYLLHREMKKKEEEIIQNKNFLEQNG